MRVLGWCKVSCSSYSLRHATVSGVSASGVPRWSQLVRIVFLWGGRASIGQCADVAARIPPACPALLFHRRTRKPQPASPSANRRLATRVLLLHRQLLRWAQVSDHAISRICFPMHFPKRKASPARATVG
ncbi:hypothetical protein KCP75_05060 [Salmonella enterica subsp. enterica]|nr:hypothetical protein KCP75_05060 [Salmonella enterica subsp. enterica]